MFKLHEEMAYSSTDESGSENKLDEIFGESRDEEDFGGFVFEVPNDIKWEKDPSDAACQSYKRIIHMLHLNVGIVAQLLIKCLAVGG